MTLWIVFGVLSLVALAFAVLPLLYADKPRNGLAAFVVIAFVALSAGLYFYQGEPEIPSGVDATHSMDEVVDALVARLDENPEDTSGWKMLGRTYLSLGNAQGAVDAFEKANELEEGQDAPTLTALAVAKFEAAGGQITDEVSALFESALAVDPNNPEALFYAGITAAERGDTALAANRWERLLSLNPPPEIENILLARVAEWRGEAPPEMPAGHPEEAAAQPEAVNPHATAAPDPDAIVNVSLSLSAEARAALPAEAGIFVIARDPAQPSPPIAVLRRRLSELPATVSLGDGNSMVAGRELSAFEQFEVVARVSLSGQPMQQSGDWFGAVTVHPAESANVELSIDTQVP